MQTSASIPVAVVLPLLVHVQEGEVIALWDEELFTRSITLLGAVVGPEGIDCPLEDSIIHVPFLITCKIFMSVCHFMIYQIKMYKKQVQYLDGPVKCSFTKLKFTECGRFETALSESAPIRHQTC